MAIEIRRAVSVVRDDDNGEVIPAASLVGLKLGQWLVVEAYVGQSIDPSGGLNSFGYLVENEDGQKAFLKALDYRQAMRSDDSLERLHQMTSRALFERQIVDLACAGRKISRIVRVYEQGSVELEFDEQVKWPKVEYLVMERADADLRDLLSDRSFEADLTWRLWCLKDVAAALAQIHPNIAHQDLKPSNTMVFKNENRTKIGDFGSATGLQLEHPDLVEEADLMMNDPAYSPPELQYGFRPANWTERHLALDLYLFANLTVFLLDGGNNLTVAVIDKLPRGMRPACDGGNWHGSFETVLPHLDEAFAEFLEEFRVRLIGTTGSEEIASRVVDVVRQLGCPDPLMRGRRRRSLGPCAVDGPFGLEQVISTFSQLYQLSKVRNPRRA